jgi:hypothetical protein
MCADSCVSIGSVNWSSWTAYDEKISLAFQNPKSRDYDRGAQVMVRNDLQKDLDECMDKLSAHTQRLNEYAGWQQVLAANPESRQALDIDDWLFFFGKE